MGERDVLPGSGAFYQFLGVIEAILTLSIAVTAWQWPRWAAESPRPIDAPSHP